MPAHFFMNEFQRNVINSKVERELGQFPGSEAQTFSGTDIKAVMYLPLLTANSVLGKNPTKIKVFGDLQTISISSARSISPVRRLGKSNPVAFTRGAVTFAGTMVFATINRDAFSEIYDTDLGESAVNASNSIIAHQLPPFSIVITAGNEKGAAGIQVIHGITITNYGTTYSVDDLYTETSYTYVATDCTPLVPASDDLKKFADVLEGIGNTAKTITQLVSESMDSAYGFIQSAATTTNQFGLARKNYQKSSEAGYDALIKSKIQPPIGDFRRSDLVFPE